MAVAKTVAFKLFNVLVLNSLRTFRAHERIIIMARMVCGTALLLAVLVWCGAYATPMLYKKNTEQKFEADLVAVSSTVIPLTVLEVSYGLGGKPSEEYKTNYLKKLRKKVQHDGGDKATVATADEYEKADTLITVKTKHHHDAKVKGI